MSNNIILITGASSDIGLDLIENIEQEALILAHYYNSNKSLKALSKKINNQLITIKSDLSDEKQIISMLESLEKKYGIPNKIIHLAAPKFKYVRFKDINLGDFQRELDISLKSLIIILNKLLPKLANKKEGKVVCMLSSSVINIPPKALSQYTIVKYALLGLVKSLASEYADKNIQINAISPSMIETKFLQDLNIKHIELNAFNHPLNRNAITSDITPIIKLLISHDSDYINGVNIPITGGSIF
jgi:3-oxoacyl-[acyl-carrier protein] reductase